MLELLAALVLALSLSSATPIKISDGAPTQASAQEPPPPGDGGVIIIKGG